LFDELQSLFTVVTLLNVVSQPDKVLGNVVPELGIVVDHQNVKCIFFHRRTPAIDHATTSGQSALPFRWRRGMRHCENLIVFGQRLGFQLADAR
jgi:hypothetical protein